jgi:hypothetical protein
LIFILLFFAVIVQSLFSVHGTDKVYRIDGINHNSISEPAVEPGFNDLGQDYIHYQHP